MISGLLGKKLPVKGACVDWVKQSATQQVQNTGSVGSRALTPTYSGIFISPNRLSHLRASYQCFMKMIPTWKLQAIMLLARLGLVHAVSLRASTPRQKYAYHSG